MRLRVRARRIMPSFDQSSGSPSSTAAKLARYAQIEVVGHSETISGFSSFLVPTGQISLSHSSRQRSLPVSAPSAKSARASRRASRRACCCARSSSSSSSSDDDSLSSLSSSISGTRNGSSCPCSPCANVDDSTSVSRGGAPTCSSASLSPRPPRAGAARVTSAQYAERRRVSNSRFSRATSGSTLSTHGSRWTQPAKYHSNRAIARGRKTESTATAARILSSASSLSMSPPRSSSTPSSSASARLRRASKRAAAASSPRASAVFCTGSSGGDGSGYFGGAMRPFAPTMRSARLRARNVEMGRKTSAEEEQKGCVI